MPVTETKKTDDCVTVVHEDKYSVAVLHKEIVDLTRSIRKLESERNRLEYERNSRLSILDGKNYNIN